jgi:heterodisulfide reductase subunit D
VNGASWPSYFKSLEIESTICSTCGYCRTVCPTYAEVGWESCSPRGRIQLARMMLDGLELPPAQVERLYQCTMCGHCTEVCSTRIDLRHVWLEARHQIVNRQGGLPAVAGLGERVAASGNVYGSPAAERMAWVEDVEEPPADLWVRQQAEVVYFPGCSSALTPRNRRIARSFTTLLAAGGVDFALLGEHEVCCGFPLAAAGLPDQAEALAVQNIERVRATGAETVVFTCPACRLQWQEAYADRLPGVRLLHATEFLVELLSAGKLPLKETRKVVTYHDPCDLGRSGGVYEAPRQVLAAIPGVQFVEAELNRERTLCCGGGGDLEMIDPGLVSQVAARSVKNLAETGARAIVTACPQCVRTLARSAKENGSPVQVIDIVELLVGALESKE